MSVEVATDDEREADDETEEDIAWKEFHRYQCFFAKRAPETEQVRKWKVNKTGRGKANLQKRGKVIKYTQADQTTQYVLMPRCSRSGTSGRSSMR